MFPIARREVPTNTLVNYRGVLDSDLEMRGIKKKLMVSNELLDRLLQEAYRRAAEQDKESIPRVGPMFAQVEAVAAQVARICEGDREFDPIIKRVLAHYDSSQSGSR